MDGHESTLVEVEPSLDFAPHPHSQNPLLSLSHSHSYGSGALHRNPPSAPHPTTHVDLLPSTRTSDSPHHAGSPSSHPPLRRRYMPMYRAVGSSSVLPSESETQIVPYDAVRCGVVTGRFGELSQQLCGCVAVYFYLSGRITRERNITAGKAKHARFNSTISALIGWVCDISYRCEEGTVVGLWACARVRRWCRERG